MATGLTLKRPQTLLPRPFRYPCTGRSFHSASSPRASWRTSGDSYPHRRGATPLPDSPMDEGFHGVPSVPWNEAPTTAPDWRHAAGQLMGLPEPPFHWKPEKNRSAVAATKGPDGRIGPG